MRSILLSVLLLTASLLSAQSIIPAPVQMEMRSGVYTITSTTSLVAPNTEDARRVVKYFTDQFKRASGISLSTSPAAKNGIVFQLNTKEEKLLGKEGYAMDITAQGITVRANTSAGLFYSVQSLLQLLPHDIERKTVTSNRAWEVPACTIMDYPRFGWRGLMLDVSRHFFSKEYVKEYIDWMARYKFNRFHWHLTDDQGWRVEIKSLPKLTSIGSWRVPRTGTFGSNTPPKPGEAATDGGYYTQEDIKEIVQYAKDRFIEILPEVDVPGHSMAAIAAYPELSVTKDTNIKVSPGHKFSNWFGNGKFEMTEDNTLNPIDENTYVFLDKVFGEIATLFPFEYIHMGGDECYRGYWERDANVQAYMKKNKIKDSEALQAQFNKRVTQIINSKNKKLIGWDEILEGGIADGAAVMSWRGVKGGIEATHLKRPVVMSPAPIFYLDMMQGDAATEAPVYSSARLKDVYAFDIIAPGIDSTYVLGGQGNLWTEQIPTAAQAEYMTYPRGLAIVEGLWSPRSKRNWEDFTKRLENHFPRFDAAGKNYATSMYDPIISVKKNKEGKLVIELTTEVKGLDIYYTIDNSIPNHFHPRYSTSIVVPDDVDNFRVIAYRNGKPVSNLISLKTEELVKRVSR